MMNSEIFNLGNLPDRTSKPRENGLTMVMDKGLSIRQVEDFLEQSKPYSDIVKLGFGTSILTSRLTDKIKLYKDAGLKVYVGGTLFEAYIARNQYDDYMRMLDKLGLEFAEVSDGSLDISRKDKCDYIKKMSKHVTVISEVGSKDIDKIIPPYMWIEMMEAELEAGVWKIITEARESGTVGIFRKDGEVRSGLIAEIIRKIPLDKIIWEAPIKSQQVWFLKLYGTNVNLGNISPWEVISLETLRMGLRGDSFDFFR